MPGYAPQFYTLIEGKAASTNVLPELNLDFQIPIYFIKNAGNRFYIRIEGTNSLNPALPVFLTDLKTQTMHDLTSSPAYSFSGAYGDDPLRFILHFNNTTGISVNNFERHIPIEITYYHQELHVYNPESRTGQVNLINLTGQRIASFELNGDMHQIHSLNCNITPGYYIAQLKGTYFLFSMKILLW